MQKRDVQNSNETQRMKNRKTTTKIYIIHTLRIESERYTHTNKHKIKI